MSTKNKSFLKLIILALVLVCVGIIGFLIYLNINKNNNKLKTKETNIVDKKDKLIDEEIINDDNKLDEKEELEIVEENTINTSKSKDSSSSKNNSSNSSSSNQTKKSYKTKENTNTSNNVVSNETKVVETTPSKETPKEEIKHEEVQTKPAEDLTKIANPNDFYYSITGGNVEFSTNAGCMEAGEDIAFIDVVDVQYFRCYEVTSKANTIMGYYLNIFCENGNCNSRYKSMINIKSYN